MTTTLRPHRNGTTPTAPDAPTFDLEPPSGGGRSRWPEVTVGMLIIGLFALAGGWLYSNAADAEPVLSLRNDIERGHVITTNDLRVVEIGSEGTVLWLPTQASTSTRWCGVLSRNACTGKTTLSVPVSGSCRSPNRSIMWRCCARSASVRVGKNSLIGRYGTTFSSTRHTSTSPIRVSISVLQYHPTVIQRCPMPS